MNPIKFYKGVLESDLKSNYIPGTVTTVFNEALMWKERIESKKNKGAARNVRHGKAVVIELFYSGKLGTELDFQASGKPEHQRNNCWTSRAKTKAQINTVCQYRVLSVEELNNLFTI